MLVKMKKRRCHIEYNYLAQNTIAWFGEAVSPGMEKRNPGGAPLCTSGFEVTHSPENLHTVVTKRCA
jgi:hypothetical protein